MKTTNKKNLEVMFEGDCTAEAKNFEQCLIGFFEMRRLQGDKIQIIKAKDDDRLSGVYSVKESRKIISLSAFVGHVSDMIGFEIAERQTQIDNVTLIDRSGFKLSATLEEA